LFRRPQVRADGAGGRGAISHFWFCGRCMALYELDLHKGAGPHLVRLKVRFGARAQPDPVPAKVW
jgi:hypothetical protein